MTLTTWLIWPFRLFTFAIWFLKEMVVASLTVLTDNLTPGQKSTTGIARCDTECQTDAEATLLAALLTLTPGTLGMGTELTADGRRVVYIHNMYAPDAESTRQEVHDMENRMLRAIRRNPGGQS